MGRYEDKWIEEKARREGKGDGGTGGKRVDRTGIGSYGE